MSNLKLTLKAWPVIAIATIGLCFLTELVFGWFGIELKEQATVEQMRRTGVYAWKLLTQHGFAAVIKDRCALSFVINLPFVIIVMPIIEELIFRGGLYKAIMKAITRRVPKSNRVDYSLIFISSLIFSLAHYLATPETNNAFIALIFFGIAQCWLYRKTAHLWCAMLNHCLFNLTNMILLFVVPAP